MQPRTPMDIQELARAFMLSRTILTAHELRVFDRIADGHCRAEEIAQATGTDTRAMDRLLNALVGFGLLTKSEDAHFDLTEIARQALVSESPDFVAGLDHTAQLWNRWHYLTESVRLGTAAAPDLNQPRSREWTERFIAAMQANAAPKADELVSMLDLSGVRRVLDLGGGSGAYAAAFARRDERIEPILFDLPDVLDIAAGYLGKAGILHRIRMLAGDMLRDPLGGPYDLIWVSAIVHMFSPEENAKLLQRCAEVLAPGGQLVIHDFIMDETRTQPPAGALFALNMLVNTRRGDSYTEQEIREWMENAGLRYQETKQTRHPTALMIAKKDK
ncbi:MAG: SAM-dependent methyltransferase [Candidatus Sumerlaea sp.]|uniref:O-methyltransferase, family 2 n=1 Tax=Sumerlaea chitinivorans TaxID=2250252 RepID=A0A2Z4Y3H5_SUMC1|nr:O-methyltransferase, family 2 [Candidatus Sumerlaea chitinivorans]GIX45311.1 MAG: SAM-dependent methyltransferase [Candidatus Sumerlaea sp.]